MSVSNSHEPEPNTLAPELLTRIACPTCRRRPSRDESSLRCDTCGVRYEWKNGVLDLRPGDAAQSSELGDWSGHWDAGNQALPSQRFFSWYRKAVFARAVAWFVSGFFPRRGVFVEAGSGTAETSMRIDKAGGQRILVAADLVVQVLDRCHPVMDARIGADNFRLPFLDHSIDGLWNVGVMEHFTHDRIDAMLREFHRVLAPGAPILLLWPATNSLPQKALRLVEYVINTRRATPFKFHPDEISKLRSRSEGRDVLERNGFQVTHIDDGVRTLMAFRTLVGRKPGERASAS